MKKLSILAAAGLLFAIATPVAAEDMTIVSEVTTNGKSSSATQYITENKMRWSDGQFDSIMEYDTGRIVHIDHKKKKYSETSLQELNAKMAELASMMDGNPMLEKMLGTNGDVSVTKGDGSREIAGYNCDLYHLKFGTKFKIDMWIAPDLSIPVNYYDIQKMVYAMQGPLGSSMGKLYDEMKKIKGMPLASDTRIDVMGMNINTSQTATEVRLGSLPSSAFAIPAYKKKKSAF